MFGFWGWFLLFTINAGACIGNPNWLSAIMMVFCLVNMYVYKVLDDTKRDKNDEENR